MLLAILCSSLSGYSLSPQRLHLNSIPLLPCSSSTSFSLVSIMGMMAIPDIIPRVALAALEAAQAARLRMMFMIAASIALLCIVATPAVLRSCVSSEYHIRGGCIDMASQALRQASSDAIRAVINVAVAPVQVPY
ncbi:hypothetical protein BC827DRAFT_1227428, partial [Russula dissimulans]